MSVLAVLAGLVFLYMGFVLARASYRSSNPTVNFYGLFAAFLFAALGAWAIVWEIVNAYYN